MRVYLPGLCVTLRIWTLMMGLALVCDLWQVSVAATPLISLIYLNYKQFGKSCCFVTVTWVVSALVRFLGKMRIQHWGNEVATGGMGNIFQDPSEADGKGSKFFPWAACALPLLKHIWKQRCTKLTQIFIRFEELSVHFLNTSKGQTGIVDACSLLFTHLKSSPDEA